MPPSPTQFSAPSPAVGRWLALWFLGILGLHLAALLGGWGGQNLSGNEFRQCQTALSAHFIQHDGNFGLAYPTPVLGKPWAVPFEFPLYQWAVVGVSELTRWPLIQSARLVSAVCFYLALPAVWLILGHAGVERRWRWIVLGLVLTCPIHVFYARAFLIETMALLLALWFLAAFVQALRGGAVGWLVLAQVAGVGAGLVKVTTFAVVLGAVALWTVALWWREGRPSPWRRLARAAGLVAFPCAASVWWVQHADAVKALNPAAQFTLSGSLHDFNFGAWAERATGALWAGIGANLLQGVAGGAMVAAGAVAWVWAGRRRGAAGAALVVFAAPLLVFPVLYKVHDYYFMANAVFLAAGCGLALAGALERPGAAGWLAAAALVVIPLDQARSYFAHYRDPQLLTHPGAGVLTHLLAEVTAEDDVLIVAGRDWNAQVPFETRRRALMVRGREEAAVLERWFAALEGESVGALVLTGAQRANTALREQVQHRFALDPRPVFSVGDDDVYVPAAVWATTLEFLRTVPVAELRLPAASEPANDPWRGRVVELARLPMVVRRHFRVFTPEPVRSEATFSYSCAEGEAGPLFSVHPTTRLWFRPPARRCRLETSYEILAAAYEGRKPGEGTDGIQIFVTEVRADGARRVLFDRHLNPARRVGDRGRQSLALDCDLAEGAELLVETTAGPHGNWAFDWAMLGPLRLEARR